MGGYGGLARSGRHPLKVFLWAFPVCYRYWEKKIQPRRHPNGIFAGMDVFGTDNPSYGWLPGNIYAIGNRLGIWTDRFWLVIF